MYTREWKKGNNKQLSCCGGDVIVVVVGSCKVLRRSTGHSRPRENSRTSAKSRKIKWEPARDVRAAAAQSYRRPSNGVVGEEEGGA